MSNTDDEALHRQTLIRELNLATVGIGCCPACHQRAEIFSRQRVAPGPTKECCLDCWRSAR